MLFEGASLALIWQFSHCDKDLCASQVCMSIARWEVDVDWLTLGYCDSRPRDRIPAFVWTMVLHNCMSRSCMSRFRLDGKQVAVSHFGFVVGCCAVARQSVAWPIQPHKEVLSTDGARKDTSWRQCLFWASASHSRMTRAFVYELFRQDPFFKAYSRSISLGANVWRVCQRVFNIFVKIEGLCAPQCQKTCCCGIAQSVAEWHAH